MLLKIGLSFYIFMLVAFLAKQIYAESEDGILSCSWGKNFCSWKPSLFSSSKQNALKWSRSKSAQSYGKEVRATPTSADDFFLWASGGDVQQLIHKEVVVLQSVEFYNPAKGILSFFHVAQSPSPPGLYVNVTLNGHTSTVKRFQGFQHHWKQRTIEIAGPGRVVVVIAAAAVGHGIDEMEYSRDAEIAVFREVVVPFPRPVVIDREISCSFRNSLCGWSPFPGLVGKWLRTSSASHLPAGFVNTSSNPWEDNWFANVNEREHHGEDAQAALVTHTFQQNSPSWLSFWWSKFEPERAESAIFVKVITENSTESIYYSKLPTRFWVNQNVSIPFIGKLRLVIGFRLTTEISYGALDEVQFSGDLQAK